MNLTSNLSARNRLSLVIAATTIIIVGLFSLGVFGMATISGMRAFVSAEGLWSKSQKDMTIHLQRYAASGDVKEYEQFKERFARPLGDKQARLELEKKNPDFAVAIQGLVQGGNHSADVWIMTRLFRWFRNFKHIDRAINVWARADVLIEELAFQGEELHQLLASGEVSEKRLTAIIHEIELVDDKLTTLEEEFSMALGEASRWAKGLLTNVMAGFTLVAIVICLGLLLFVGRIMLRMQSSGEELARQGEKLARQNKMTAAQNALNERMRGELTESDFCQNVIGFLATHLDVLVGIFYVAEDQKVLRAMGTYAYYQRKNVSEEILFGNGPVGQAAQQKKYLQLSQIPEDLIQIQSALGEGSPRHVLVFPLTLSGRVKGVLELGAFNAFTEEDISFLEQVAESISVALEMIHSHAKMQ